MNKPAAALLFGYLSSQLEDIQRLYKKVQRTEPHSEEQTVYLGYLLHNLYCAFEDLFLEIAKTFENQVEDPARFHKVLLKRMMVEVPKIRPRVLSRESHLVFDELRGFRHVFRHAYGYTLDPDKVAMLKESVEQHWNNVLADIDAFKGFLQDILNSEE